MSKVPKFGNEINGCHATTTFVKHTYVFDWSVKNFPPYASLFKATSPEFRPLSDRLFCATIERKYNSSSSGSGYVIILSILMKEGLPIEIKHAISITNCAGKILSNHSGTHKHSLVSGCHPAFNASIVNDYTIFKTEDYPCINFKCTMEYGESPNDLRNNYHLPSSTISPSTLVDDLKTMYTNSVHTDLCLNVGESSVHVHKGMLCVRSPVFAKMFESPMGEKKDNVINIDDIELPVVKGLVEFLYTGVLCDDGFDFVYDLYYAADKYDVSSLRKTCTDVLLAKLDVDNAFRVLVLADQHSDVQFRDAVMEFIQFRFDDIVQTKRWSEILDDETKLAAEVMRCRSLKSKKVSK